MWALINAPSHRHRASLRAWGSSVNESLVIFNARSTPGASGGRPGAVFGVPRVSPLILGPTLVRVLLVENDPAMVRVLERGLSAHDFEVTSLEPAAAAVTLAADTSVRIAVLDVSPSTRSGRTLLEDIRRRHATLPLLFLVARDAPETGEAALEKPFAMEELIARIHALTRAADEPRVTILTAGDLRLDLLARCAWRGERLIDLPSREF